MQDRKQPYRTGGMSKTRIEEHLADKFDDFLKSLTDSQLRHDLREGAIITGGSIASLLLGERVNDYDIYLKDEKLAKAVRKYFFINTKNEDLPDSWSPEWLAGYLEDNILVEPEVIELEIRPPYHLRAITQNAISLANGIQIITRFTGGVEEIHACYDFIHCTNWWDAKTGQLHLKMDALESLMAKQLRYRGSRFPICSLLRTRKFLKRGWTINAGQMLKIMLQVSDLDLHDTNVLKEQLIGVDSVYFNSLLSAIKESPEQIDRDGLVRLIDATFH